MITDRYKKAYKDYYVKEITTPKGKTRKKYVYTGTLFRMNVSDKKWYLVRAWQTLLFLGAVVLFIIPATREYSSNMNSISAFPQMCAVLSFFIQAYAIIQYWLCSRDLTEWDINHSSKLLKTISLISAICCLAVFIFSVIFLFVNHEVSAGSILICFLYLAAGGLMVVSHIIESRLSFSANKSRVYEL